MDDLEIMQHVGHTFSSSQDPVENAVISRVKGHRIRTLGVSPHFKSVNKTDSEQPEN